MKIYIIRAFSLFLAILTASIIFSFSADTGEESGELSAEITNKVLTIFGISEENASSQEYQKMKTTMEFFIRKLAHFSEYALLGFMCCVFFRTFKQKMWLTTLFSLLLSISYAALDEWHQSFVPGRGPGVGDVLIDSSGAICGVLAALLAWYLVHLIAKKRKMKRRYA